jgi:hypothetical protein
MCAALSGQEAMRAQVTIGFLGHFVKSGWQFWLECLDKPARGSFIARAKRSRALSQALDVSLLLADANDHFLDVVDEFTQGYLPSFALYAVVRGALEADARACWLAEPGLTDRERLARALTLRADSLFEMRRLGLPPKSKLPPGLTSAGHYTKRIRRVVATGSRWKLVAKKHKDGRVSFVDLPKVTPLLVTLLPTEVAKIRYGNKVKRLTLGERTYGELSARAHATSWALLSNVASKRRLDSFRQYGEVNLDVLELIRLLGVAVSLHDEALQRLALWAGRQRQAWESMRGSIPW